MHRVRELATVLEEIDVSCDTLIKKALSLMRQVLSDKEDMVKSIREKNNRLSEHDAGSRLTSLSTGLVRDPKRIKTELPHFCAIIASNSPIEDATSIDFLKEVWCGDSYGSIGLDSLKRLLEDLKSQLTECTADHLISAASK